MANPNVSFLRGKATSFSSDLAAMLENASMNSTSRSFLCWLVYLLANTQCSPIIVDLYNLFSLQVKQ